MFYRMFSVAVIGLTAIAYSAPSHARGLGGEASELVGARANARAGGPVSERDAELLDRYGCLSGTRSAFCDRDYRSGRYGYSKRSKRDYYRYDD